MQNNQVLKSENTGLSRVSIHNLFFPKKNYKNTKCLYVELSEPMILVIEPWLHIRNPLHQRVLGMIPRKCSGIFNLVEPLR